jgi:hypothetical protein
MQHRRHSLLLLPVHYLSVMRCPAFRHKAKWSAIWEIAIYCIVVLRGAALDLLVTKVLFDLGSQPVVAKITPIGI